MYHWTLPDHKNVVIFPDNPESLQYLQKSLGTDITVFPAVFFYLNSSAANSGDLSFFEQLLPYCTLPKLRFQFSSFVIEENVLYLLLHPMEPEQLAKFQNFISTFYHGVPAQVLLPLLQLPSGQSFSEEKENVLIEQLLMNPITFVFDPRCIQLHKPESKQINSSTLKAERNDYEQYF